VEVVIFLKHAIVHRYLSLEVELQKMPKWVFINNQTNFFA
jgi:hypothetical protein